MVEVKATGQKYVLQLWIGASKNLLPAKYLCCNETSFYVSRFHGHHITHKDEANPESVWRALPNLIRWCVSDIMKNILVHTKYCVVREYLSLAVNTGDYVYDNCLKLRQKAIQLGRGISKG